MAKAKEKAKRSPREPLLTQMRKSRGESLQTVGKACGIDGPNLHRIERGEQVPKRDTARALFDYYQGAVPLGAIYDPTHPTAATE